MTTASKYTDDKVLLIEISEGSQEAMTILFNKYYGVMCFFCNRKLDDLNLSREVVQDVFVRIWEKRSKLLHIDNFEGFLFTSIRNAATDTFRYKSVQRKKEMDIALADYNIDNQIPDESVEALYKQVNTLPKQLKGVIKGYLSGLKTEEIASELSISIPTVRSYKRTAIEIIKNKLK